MQNLIPQTILGRFKLLSLLGRGGMGEVWKAQDVRLSREVAIKILPPHTANDTELQLRFERESKILASLNHPNIAQIYEAGEELAQHPEMPPVKEKISFLVMEMIEGRSLSQILRQGPLPVTTVIRIGRQVARALEAAHDSGIIHRDLKPANIMVTPKNIVKVLDFGLARPIGRNKDGSPTLPDVTASGMILGTAAYLSPEQVRGEPADVRSDIWSLGCVLYQMASGQAPFSSDSIPEIMAGILRDPPPSLLEINPDIPLSLNNLIESCLAKEPKNRPQKAMEIVGSLKSILQEIRHRSAGGTSPAQPGGAGTGGNAPNSLNIQIINRYLKMTNPDWPQLPVSKSGPSFVELAHGSIRIGIIVSPRRNEAVDMIAFISPVARFDMETADDKLRKLLSLCYSYSDVAQFAIDRDSNMINLTCVRPCAHLDYRAFQYTLQAMGRIAKDFLQMKTRMDL